MEEGKYKTLTEFQDGSALSPEEITTGLKLGIIEGITFVPSQYPEKITGKAKDDLYLIVKARWTGDNRRIRNGYVRVPLQNANQIASAYTVEFGAWVGKVVEFYIQKFRQKEYVRVKPRPDLNVKKKDPEAEKPVEAHL